MQIGVRQARVRALLNALFQAGLEAVDPARAVRRAVTRAGDLLRVGPRQYDLRRFDRVVAVGAGKASAGMAAALEAILGDRLESGLVVVKYGHAEPTRRIEVQEAGHPVPDHAGQRAAGRLLRLVAGLSSKDLLFVLLSGGASSLLPVPWPGLTLSDKQRTTRLLLRSGASIQEINAVRKHLSAIKGGRLAAATKAAVVSLLLSDVPGDQVGAIGSGPTAADDTTYRDAVAVLRGHGLWEHVPARVRACLEQGRMRRRGYPETPKPGASLFRRVQNHLIGNNEALVDAVARAAKRAGLKPLIVSTSLAGEAREAAKVFSAIAREVAVRDRPVSRPCCVIAGGELTVSVRGAGRGGRAQEFALAAALEIHGLPRVWVAALATDGTDGPTDAAGAVVDGRTLARATRQGLDPFAALDGNDAYPFFRRLGAHIITGPTGTNVNDLYLLIAL
ncbi:MAG: glycerate kinase type-2 family protein [Nitrospiraceae bacterium]